MEASLRIPAATYRLQFNKDFTFAQAREIIPYLRALGISDCYASPFFRATPGSTHGYDVVDHNHFNPEIGSEADFDAMVAVLREQKMGLVADFVPNHMGIAEPINAWWMDVLENGPSSLAARCFDIDWHPLKAELENKVLLPILGDQYGVVLEKGELKLAYESGAFFLLYYQAKLPINPRTYHLILEAALDELIKANPAASNPTLADLNASETAPAGAIAESGVGELKSVISQLENMPPRTATDPDQIAERAREKEVAKLRLTQLASDHPAVPRALERAIESIQGKPGDPHSFDRMHELIEAQAYRLSYWRVAAEEINYRRFFDINTLAAIRVELPEVFDATHQLLWKLVQSGSVTGLRIDHPDGLYDPKGYFEALQKNTARLTDRPLPEDKRAVYLLGEKILSGKEELRADWPVHGTTGYDFTNQVTGVLIDQSAEKQFSETYERFINRNVHFPSLVYEKKRLVMRLSLANEINVLGYMLNRLSERNRRSRDFTLNSLTTAVREVIACFPVYRTYLTPGAPVADEDRSVILRAINLARRRNAAMETSVFAFLRDILLFRFPSDMDQETRAEHERFVMKFQQCTGPITAKGLEDTAFYIYNRLAALNEVGGEPQRFGLSPADFHATNTHRCNAWPHTMLASSTHDTKRSEDVRARIAALSEMPMRWRRLLRSWSALNAKHKTSVDGELAPDANEEYLLYQVLLGIWPFGGLARLSEEEHAAFEARVHEYMTKAIKEAKVNSSWIAPNEAWDEATRKFVTALLPKRALDPFRKSFEPVADEIARLGMINSLSQTIIKLTSPGVPDIYQGNETWDFSLVDPDNRRPVDYQLRHRMLDSLKHADPHELLEQWRDGRIKMFVTERILRRRLEAAALFQQGSYEPLGSTGRYAESVLAFHRAAQGAEMLVIVPRLTSRVGYPPLGDLWLDTALSKAPSGRWRDLFTGKDVEIVAGTLPISQALQTFPAAVLERATP